MHNLLIILAGFALAGLHPNPTITALTDKNEQAIDPALTFLGKLVGGTWRVEGGFVVEQRYEWRIPGKAIRGTGILGKGTKDEAVSEALYGWDAAAKKVYYIDLHGHDTVYRGLVEMIDGKLRGDFGGMIGDAGVYRFEDTLEDDDTLAAAMFARNKAGEWVKIHTFTFKRRR